MERLKEVTELDETVKLESVEYTEDKLPYREIERNIEALQILADQIYIRIQSNELPEYLINRLIDFHTAFLNQIQEKSLELELSRLLNHFGDKLSVAIKLKELNDEFDR